ncbi:MAG: hypothetical protein FKY71_12500 [Spiribacter salinus]|uniref:Uncharacterized protein n=1 Tax=Spiribacter salinus TaxID=1335746 RepID=A0A540VPK0_9GAMM|nr:MAG: hypothetical protein FKY71_12500 [Spiribacter salinus]
MTTTKRTALSAFTQHADDCAALLDHLGEVIAKTREQFKADSTNWGYAGSMAEVRSNLIQILAFIGGLEEDAIEATLADLRKDA